MLRASLVLLVLLVGLGWHREARADGSRAMTVSDAVREAEQAAPDVVVSAARATTSRTQVAVAGIVPNPRLTVGSTTGSSAFVGSLFLALPIFGQRGSAMEASEAQAVVARAGVDVARVDARLAVTLAWTDLWVAQREAAVAVDVASRRERLVETTRVRFTEGAGSRLDVLRAETEARRARADADARRNEIDAAVARLCILLGRDPLNDRVEAAGDPPYARAVPAPATLSTLIDMHPVSQRAKFAVRAADAVVARENRARWPLLGVQVGTALANRAPPPTNDFSAALSVDVPIFSGPLITRAEASRSEASAERASTLAILKGRLDASRSDYLAADRRYRASVDEVLPTAREAAELALEGYRSRGLDLTATLAVEQALTDAQLAAVRAEADRARAYAALEHAAGRPL